MPSPLAHLAAGFALYTVYSDRRHDNRPWNRRRRTVHALFVAGATMLPDFDSVLGVLSGDFGRFHNNVSHSLFVGLVAAAIIGLFVARQLQEPFARWFVLALLLYELHVVLDFSTPGRGVMALWPFTAARFSSPLDLFYGFHWSDGLFSIKHVWTVATESAFAMTLYFLLRVRRKGNGGPDTTGRQRRREQFY